MAPVRWTGGRIPAELMYSLRLRGWKEGEPPPVVDGEGGAWPCAGWDCCGRTAGRASPGRTVGEAPPAWPAAPPRCGVCPDNGPADLPDEAPAAGRSWIGAWGGVGVWDGAGGGVGADPGRSDVGVAPAAAGGAEGRAGAGVAAGGRGGAGAAASPEERG